MHGFSPTRIIYTLYNIMAGLYIHIPFCASRCIYCAFYSTTSVAVAEQYVETVCKEMQLRAHEIERVDTIYLGGGTPSLLSADSLHLLFTEIARTFKMGNDVEVTMECNPDDITPDFANTLRSLPVNRISMGVQSFDNARLKFLHRRHNNEQVYSTVERLHEAKIDNISIDLIFGFPGETLSDWENDIDEALRLDVQHISSYSLTYEEKTPLIKLKQKGLVKEIDEETSIRMYQLLIDKLEAAGFEHYEISNFAKIERQRDGKLKSYHSRHNSGYWKGVPYLGLGAAAHSYDGSNRKWNVADLKQYMVNVNQGTIPCEKESLNTEARYNDCITTALRTKDGIDLEWLQNTFGRNYLQHLMKESKTYLDAGQLALTSNRLRLTRKGIMISDMIMSDLMYID